MNSLAAAEPVGTVNFCLTVQPEMPSVVLHQQGGQATATLESITNSHRLGA